MCDLSNLHHDCVKRNRMNDACGLLFNITSKRVIMKSTTVEAVILKHCLLWTLMDLSHAMPSVKFIVKMSHNSFAVFMQMHTQIPARNVLHEV